MTSLPEQSVNMEANINTFCSLLYTLEKKSYNLLAV